VRLSGQWGHPQVTDREFVVAVTEGWLDPGVSRSFMESMKADGERRYPSRLSVIN